MTTLTRLLTVQYGSRTITGPSELIRFHDGWETGEFSFRFVVRAANMAALATACDAVIQDFRIPHQRLQVKFNGTAEIDWNPSAGAAGNTAFQLIPHIAKHGGPWDSGTAQEFEVTISCSKPADKDSRVGRRFADVNVTWSESRRRTLSISGMYTAVTTNDSVAQYAAQAATFASGIRTGLGGTWELSGENYSRDDIDKELRFTLVYQEIIHALLVASLVNQHVYISVANPHPGDSPTPSNGRVTRVANVSVRFDASVNSGTTTDLEAVYQSLLPLIAAKVAAAVPAAGLALINPGKTLDYDENRISLDQTWEAVLSSDMLEYHRYERLRYSPGRVVISKWAQQRFSKYVFQGPETMTCEVREVIVLFGSRDRQPQLLPVMPLSIPPEGASWEYTGKTDDWEEQIHGGNGYEFPVVMIDRTHSFEAAVVEQSAVGAGAVAT